MIRILLYLFSGLVAACLAALVVYRRKSYHSFMVRQCNMKEEEYDRIYS